jgi:hypothetical protein
MAIYSQHPNRGKTQILAAFDSPSGWTSVTVTSVEDASAASRVVDALNRLSACATVPISIWDTRFGPVGQFPTGHLDAICDKERHHELLTGSHSLWYEYVMLLLHEAITDLDASLAKLPDPVQTAVREEVAAEVSALRTELARYDGTVEAGPSGRGWAFGLPSVAFGGGLQELEHGTRREMDRAEAELPDGGLEAAADALRLLFAVDRAAHPDVMFEPGYLDLMDDPEGAMGPDRYYVAVGADVPDGSDAARWAVRVSRWDIDLDAPENADATATGDTLLVCDLDGPPAVDELVGLFSLSRNNVSMIASWAQTAIGEPLHGTAFVVTQRFDH